MSRSTKSRSGQLPSLFPPALEAARPPTIRPRAASSFTALWLADPPTWALGRLHPSAGSGQGLEPPPDQPVLAVSGGRVVGSNLPARRAGVRPDESLSRALQLCPQAKVYPHDPPAMMAAWDSAVAAAYSLSPWVEPAGVGLLFAGALTPREAGQLARMTGARVGQSASRSTAQLAALTAKEGSARAVPNEAHFIAQVPVRLLLGLGFAEELVERLHWLGVDHLADLHRLGLTQRQLEAQFRSEGRRLYQVAHGGLTEPVQRFREPPVARERWEFEEPAVEPYQFMPVLHLLVANAATRLGNKACWTVTVALQGGQGWRLGRRVLGAATNRAKALLGVAELTFWDVHTPGSGIEALEVTLGRIVLPEAEQQDLFGAFDRPPVWEAIERVDGRFNGGIGRLEVGRVARFREEFWRFVPLGSSQKPPVGDGRRLR
ncbi:MAG: hypothetical protein SFU83_04025 [Meiothermus sp.]|nr:hypothetical protein [Meiothermus sp.]